MSPLSIDILSGFDFFHQAAGLFRPILKKTKK